MERLEKLVRPHILTLKPYSSARDDFNGIGKVYLDANENSFGSIPAGNLNRYPDPYQIKLKVKLAKLKDVDVGNLFIGNGSDEPIDLLIRAFCQPGIDNVMILPPTYGMYKVSANVNNVGVKSIPLTDRLQINSAELKNATTLRDKIIFICSPNNPTGNLIDINSVLALLKSFHGLVVVDEAYIDFAAQSSFIDRLEEFPNLVVLQTFSKAWGLAAIRLGVAYADTFVIDILNKIKPPYNIDKVSQETGYKALSQIDKKELMVKKIISERNRLKEKLASISNVEKVFHSNANFLLVRFKNYHEVNNHLQSNGVIVRDRSKELYCDGCLRITIGTPKENERLLQLLGNFK